MLGSSVEKPLEKSLVSLIGAMVVMLGTFGAFISFTMNDISKNIKDLNASVSTLLERTGNHEKRLDRIEDRFRIEDKFGK